MKSYNFRVNLFGNMELEVLARSKKEAREMVKDLVDGINGRDIKAKKSHNKDIVIDDGNFISQIHNKERDYAR